LSIRITSKPSEKKKKKNKKKKKKKTTLYKITHQNTTRIKQNTLHTINILKQQNFFKRIKTKSAITSKRSISRITPTKKKKNKKKQGTSPHKKKKKGNEGRVKKQKKKKKFEKKKKKKV